MRRPLLDLLQRVDPTNVIVVAALIIAPVIGFLIPTGALGRLAIHGTVIVTSCKAHHPGWSNASTCHGRFDPDGDGPIIEYVTFESRHRYKEQEMFGASVASLDAREARLDHPWQSPFVIVKYALMGVPVIAGPVVLVLIVRFKLTLARERSRSRRRANAG